MDIGREEASLFFLMRYEQLCRWRRRGGKKIKVRREEERGGRTVGTKKRRTIDGGDRFDVSPPFFSLCQGGGGKHLKNDGMQILPTVNVAARERTVVLYTRGDVYGSGQSEKMSIRRKKHACSHSAFFRFPRRRRGEKNTIMFLLASPPLPIRQMSAPFSFSVPPSLTLLFFLE